MGKRYVGSVLGAALLVLCMTGGLVAVPAASAACPNEALRVGASAALPECRAYEMVSPADKGDGYVLTFYGAKAALDGNGLAFLSTAALANGGGSPLFVVDLAQRQSEGWSSVGIDPPFLNSNALAEVNTQAVSDDLGEALQTSERALAPGATEGGSNVYVRDSATGALTLVATEAGHRLYEELSIFSGHPYVGGSPDWSHLVLRSAQPLVAGAPAGVSNVYDYTDGRLEVVDRLPNGEVPPEGASVAGEPGVSADGSRVYFWLGNEGQGPLYMREDDARTVPVSVSRKPGPEEGQVVPVSFAYANGEGSVAYFVGPTELTEGSGPSDLYRYDLAERKLTDLTAASGFPASFVGASEDGSYVYLETRGVLGTEATEAPEGETNLYLWHAGTFKLVTRLGAAGIKQTQVSPNGRYLGFVSAEPLTADDATTSACPASPVAEHCPDVFAYEAATGALSCVTCAGPASGESSLGTLGETYLLLGEHESRAVLDDGSFIVDTPNRLVPRDSNGLEDVYLWREGVTSLISSGTSEKPSNFADASPDGSNIFFRTNQRLVAIDTDSTTDVYDARVDGGIAAQNPPGAPPVCSSEACRGPSPAPGARPRTAIAAGSPSTCLRLGRGAGRHAAAAKRLRRKAARASGTQAKRLRGAAAEQQAKAKHLRSRAGRCRRAGA